MNRVVPLTAALLMVAALTACIPEKRIVWSPDGERAAVATPNGLFFIGPDGRVLKPRLEGSPTRAAWFPDGRRLAVVSAAKARHWSDAEPLFRPEELSDIKVLAERLREELLEFDGDWTEFHVDAEQRMPPAIELAALLYVRDHLCEGLPEKLNEHWEQAATLEPLIWKLNVATLHDDRLELGPPLVSTFNEIYQPKVSPDGRKIALLMAMTSEPDESPALHVVSADGSAVRTVIQHVAIDYDWSPDSTSLAFIRTQSPGTREGAIQLGALCTIRVAGKDGTLLKEWEQFQDRAAVIFNPFLGVRWLTDGRLIFSAFEANLPAALHDTPGQWSLFCLDPRMPAGVSRVLRRDLDLPLDRSLALFEVSPDERRVLIPGPKGVCQMYEFATSESRRLMKPDGPEGELRCLPSWRGEVEPCFVRPCGDGTYEAVLIGSGGKIRILSRDWPEAMKEGWLTAK